MAKRAYKIGDIMFLKNNPFPLILLLAFLWGPSFLLIKFSVEEIPPITFTMLRFCIAVFLLWLILMLKKVKLSNDFYLWKHAIVMGLLESTLPVMLCAYSLKHIDSILSAIITGTSPILTVLLAYFFLKEEKLTFRSVFGIMLGLLGFLLLLFPGMMENDFRTDRLHMFLSLAAALSFAGSMIYARKFIKIASISLPLSFMQLCSTLIYLIPLSLLLEPGFSVFTVSGQTWACLSGLAMFGTVFALIVYYRIALSHGAVTLSTVTYVLPIISTLYGVILLNEEVNLHFLTASSVILLGTFMTARALCVNNNLNTEILNIEK